MEPRIIQEAKRFKATSGNQVLHVTDLGPWGMHAAWNERPSDEDKAELEQWVVNKLEGNYTVTRHNGGRTEAREAYEKWRKEKKDARIPGEED